MTVTNVLLNVTLEVVIYDGEIKIFKMMTFILMISAFPSQYNDFYGKQMCLKVSGKLSQSPSFSNP